MTQIAYASVLKVIQNDSGLYEGDLKEYFRFVFLYAENLRLPYHNFQHMTFVLSMCHMMSGYYRDRMTKREIRNLLIAALFHDFDHSGILSDDSLNIERALRGLDRCLFSEDEAFRDDIRSIIRATEYPYGKTSPDVPLSHMIIRDADAMQTFSPTWIQEIIFGLSAEQGVTPIEMLRLQMPYLETLGFFTDWAKETYPKSVIEDKLTEVRELLEALDQPSK